MATRFDYAFNIFYDTLYLLVYDMAAACNARSAAQGTAAAPARLGHYPHNDIDWHAAMQ